MDNDILAAFFGILEGAGLPYPIAYPNVKFNPPNSGVWLEVSHVPNTGIDESLSSQNVIRQGFFQVDINDRQNTGLFNIGTAASEVAALFPKLTQLADVRVSKVPRIEGAFTFEGGRVSQPLTIPYSG